MPNQKKENNNHELTLDDLARMVQEGFSHTASIEALHTLDERITGMDERMTGFDARITGLDRKIDAYHQEIMHTLKPLKETVPNLEADIIEHERRIKTLERHAGIGKE